MAREEQIGDCRLILGDCLEVMADMADASVDSVVTDPPYHLTSIVKRFGKEGSAPAQFGTDGTYQRASRGFMGKVWDGGDIAFRPETWAECLRVLKPGGHLLAFSGTRTQHRMVCAIEDAGFEIRDMIAWIYGSGFPKSHNLDDEWTGWGTALKPALEPITLARKPLIGTVAANVMEHGCGALNIDGCRVDADWNNEASVRLGHTNKVCASDGVTGWNSARMHAEPNNQGRWPANLIHDGSEEVVRLFPQTGPSKMAARGTMGLSPFSEIDGSGRNPESAGIRGHDDSGGSAARFFYTAKASKADRDDGLESRIASASERSGGRQEGSAGLVMDGGKANPYAGTTTPARNVHPTVKPTDLMRYLCRLITPPRGIVLDPFAGSGSTGMAATLEGFCFIGIEMEEQYFEIAAQRVRKASSQPDMFLHQEAAL